MMDYEQRFREFERVKAGRANFETTWQEIAERVLPQMADFGMTRANGEKRTEKMFDPTAALAAQKAVSAIAVFAWPSNQRYQKIVSTNKELNKIQRVNAWFDAATDALFESRYSPRAAFESQMSESALMSFVFGTGGMFIDEDIKGRRLRYKSLHLGRTYIVEGVDGRIDTVYRTFSMSLRNLSKRFNAFPEALKQKLQARPDDEIEVVHFVCERDDFDPQRLGPTGMPWASCYYLPSLQNHILEEGGYHTWPFGFHRYITSPGEVYGRSPAWMALSSIKVLNVQKKTVLQAGQKIVDPPLLASEDGVLSAFSQVPGAVNFGALDSQGNQLVKPLITGARVDIGLDMMDREREIIAGAFMMDVFRVLVEHPNMTATQTLELINERATIMAPIVSRYESEHFSPQTERELDLLMRAGLLPEMPPELIEAEGEYKIEYTSPMRRAMRSSEALAIVRTLEQVTPMAQIDPTVLDPFDLPEMARELGEINGMPAKCIRDAAALQAMKDKRATDAQAQQLLEAAPVISQTAANIAKVQAAGGMQPGF